MKDRRKLLVALGAGALAVLLLLGYLIWSGYREAMIAAETTSRNYAAIIEARLEATLRRADAILQERTRAMPVAALSKQAVARYAPEIDATLDSDVINFPELTGLRVFDVEGDMLYTTDSKTVPRTSIAGRDYFGQARERPPGTLIFSAVLIGRASGRPNLFLARALRDDRGAFHGIVIAALILRAERCRARRS